MGALSTLCTYPTFNYCFLFFVFCFCEKIDVTYFGKVVDVGDWYLASCPDFCCSTCALPRSPHSSLDRVLLHTICNFLLICSKNSICGLVQSKHNIKENKS